MSSVAYTEARIPMTLVIAALVLLLILVLVAVSAPVLTWSVAGIVVGVLGGWFTTLRGDR